VCIFFAPLAPKTQCLCQRSPAETRTQLGSWFTTPHQTNSLVVNRSNRDTVHRTKSCQSSRIHQKRKEASILEENLFNFCMTLFIIKGVSKKLSLFSSRILLDLRIISDHTELSQPPLIPKLNSFSILISNSESLVISSRQIFFSKPQIFIQSNLTRLLILFRPSHGIILKMNFASFFLFFSSVTERHSDDKFFFLITFFPISE